MPTDANFWSPDLITLHHFPWELIPDHISPWRSLCVPLHRPRLFPTSSFLANWMCSRVAHPPTHLLVLVNSDHLQLAGEQYQVTVLAPVSHDSFWPHEDPLHWGPPSQYMKFTWIVSSKKVWSCNNCEYDLAVRKHMNSFLMHPRLTSQSKSIFTIVVWSYHKALYDIYVMQMQWK